MTRRLEWMRPCVARWALGLALVGLGPLSSGFGATQDEELEELIAEERSMAEAARQKGELREALRTFAERTSWSWSLQ